MTRKIKINLILEGLDDLLDEFTGEEQTVSQARETSKAY